MYKLVVACVGVPRESGVEAAADITEEFAKHRTWWQNVSCTWDGTRLVLSAEIDCDPTGDALMDEFSDCVCAYVPGTFDSAIGLVSVEET